MDGSRPETSSVGRRLSPVFDAIVNTDTRKPVAAPWDRLDVPRLVRVVLERVAQALDRRVESLVGVLDEGVGGPQRGAELLTRDEGSGPAEEREQHLRRLLTEGDADAGAAQLTGVEVHLEAVEPGDVRGNAVHAHGVITGLCHESEMRDPVRPASA